MELEPTVPAGADQGTAAMAHSPDAVSAASTEPCGGIRIVTNHHRREVIGAWQLTPAERAGFDYLDWPAIDEGRDSASFVRYHGELIDLGDTEGGYGGSDPFPGWDAYVSDSFFSGIVIRYVHDEYGEYAVVIGRYFS